MLSVQVCTQSMVYKFESLPQVITYLCITKWVVRQRGVKIEPVVLDCHLNPMAKMYLELRCDMIPKAWATNNNVSNNVISTKPNVQEHKLLWGDDGHDESFIQQY